MCVHVSLGLRNGKVGTLETFIYLSFVGVGGLENGSTTPAVAGLVVPCGGKYQMFVNLSNSGYTMDAVVYR